MRFIISSGIPTLSTLSAADGSTYPLDSPNMVSYIMVRGRARMLRSLLHARAFLPLLSCARARRARALLWHGAAWRTSARRLHPTMGTVSPLLPWFRAFPVPCLRLLLRCRIALLPGAPSTTSPATARRQPFRHRQRLGRKRIYTDVVW